MDGNFFFVVGIVLVLAALAISYFGIRDSERFPPNRGILVGVTALFAAVVAVTMAFAVVKSEDEQKKRNEELAKEEQQAENEDQNAPPAATPGGQPQASGGGNQQEPTTGETTTGETSTQAATSAQTLAVTSPADGGLIFEPDGLNAKPGSITIDYDNPSPVPHSIAVAAANGNLLGEVQPFTNGKEAVQLSDVAPGKYIFYCTVPGHREAGMEGNLTVGG